MFRSTERRLCALALLVMILRTTSPLPAQAQDQPQPLHGEPVDPECRALHPFSGASKGINLTGAWSSSHWGDVAITQQGTEVLLITSTKRCWRGTIGNRLELRHKLKFDETRSYYDPQVRQQLAGQYVRLDGNLSPDGQTIEFRYFDRKGKLEEKNGGIDTYEDELNLTITLRRCKSEKDAWQIELPNAKSTLVRSREVAQSVLEYGVKNKNSDLAYWFAELYVYITGSEIDAAPRFSRPGFLLHFIPVFYDMYARNAEAYAAGKAEKISATWKLHFKISSVRTDPYNQKTQYINDATASLVSGVQAHIQGDMAEALLKTYESYSRKYCSVPPFDTYKPDFFEINRPVFEHVKLSFLNEFLNSGLDPLILAGKPLGTRVYPKTAAWAADIMKKGLDVDEIYRWREEAWQKARTEIESTR